MSMNKDKLLIARWIVRCNAVEEEIEYLLDKAYPDGAEDRFYDDWDNVLAHDFRYKEGSGSQWWKGERHD